MTSRLFKTEKNSVQQPLERDLLKSSAGVAIALDLAAQDRPLPGFDNDGRELCGITIRRQFLARLGFVKTGCNHAFPARQNALQSRSDLAADIGQFEGKIAHKATELELLRRMVRHQQLEQLFDSGQRLDACVVHHFAVTLFNRPPIGFEHFGGKGFLAVERAVEGSLGTLRGTYDVLHAGPIETAAVNHPPTIKQQPVTDLGVGGSWHVAMVVERDGKNNKRLAGFLSSAR